MEERGEGKGERARVRQVCSCDGYRSSLLHSPFFTAKKKKKNPGGVSKSFLLFRQERMSRQRWQRTVELSMPACAS